MAVQALTGVNFFLNQKDKQWQRKTSISNETEHKSNNKAGVWSSSVKTLATSRTRRNKTSPRDVASSKPARRTCRRAAWATDVADSPTLVYNVRKARVDAAAACKGKLPNIFSS